MNSKVVMTLAGGLGNQMFQYAFAVQTARSTGSEILLDTSFLRRRDLGKDFVYRSFELGLFRDIPNTCANQTFESNGYRRIKFKEPRFEYMPGLLANLQQELAFEPTILRLEGYFQSPRYFENINSVRQLFKFAKPLLSNSDSKVRDLFTELVNSDNAIMVNVRRADFVHSTFHGCLDVNYYRSAVDRIRDRVGSAKAYIFSDDIAWCMRELNIENSIVIDHGYKGESFGTYLQLMIACKNFVIPNSTFGWWAAFLANYEKKIVLYPQRWFADVTIKVEDLFPVNWHVHS